MANLSDLMKVAPTMGGFMTGEQHSSDLATELARRRDLESLMRQREMEGQRAAELHPYELETARLKPQKSLAEIEGMRTKNKTDLLGYEKAVATKDSDIAATIAGNRDKEDSARHAAAKRAHESLQEITPLLLTAPGPAQRAVLRQHLQERGMNVDAPGLRELDAAAGTPRFAQMLQAMQKRIAEQLAMMDTKANASIKSAEIAAAASRYGDDTRAKATVEAAKIGANSREEVARIRKSMEEGQDSLDAILTGKADPRKVAAAAMLRAELAERKGNMEDAAFWKKVANTAQRLGVNMDQGRNEGKLKVDPEGGGLSTRRVPDLYTDHLTPRPPAQPRGSGTKDDPIILK